MSEGQGGRREGSENEGEHSEKGEGQVLETTVGLRGGRMGESDDGTGTENGKE